MTEQIVKANGLDICCESFGAPSASPILLIMGLGGQMIAYDDDFCAALAGKGFHVVRFDNRDVGRSTRFDRFGIPDIMSMMTDVAMGKVPQPPYQLTDMAADTVGLMDALGFARAHVVGMSMGGMIAQLLAIHHGDRLLSMTSIMSTTGDRTLPPATPEASAAIMTPAPLDRAGYIRHHARLLTILRGPHFPEPPAADEARGARNYDRGISPAGAARQLAAVLASGDRTSALRSVKTPTLVIHGDADPLVRVDGGKATAAAIPSAQLKVFAGMAHTLPRALWPDLIDTLAAHARANM